MKRIILVLFTALICTTSSFGQIVGDGSINNPYHGFLNGSLFISGTKYFDGNIYVDNEALIIAAGARLVALQVRASIFITDSGILRVNGTALSPVLFTSDLDRDGIFGEPTDQWGNITITSTGPSAITYAIIERGLKNFFKFGTHGGGLSLSTSSVTVSNTLFRNCQANRGGAIAVLNGASPVISRCTFLNNSATEYGGAIYVEGGASPAFSNSLFSGNSCTSATLKGGTITSLASSPAIVNSTIVNSSSPVADGVSIYLENSSAAKVVNTVIWGGSNLIGLNSTPATVFAACALQGVNYTGNITLSSSNTAVDGPNFVNPAGGDFSIAFVSPLRDSGVDTYTGVTIPTTDINSRSRIFLSDIGAYEMVYSRWRGGTSTAWTFPKNWEGSVIPGTTNIVIPGGLVNYPTVSPGPSFTLNAGLHMIMNPGSRVTFTSLTNNGTIDIQSDATAIASLITNSYSGAGGTLKMAINVTGGDIIPGEIGRWHYIAAPVTMSKSVITDIDPYNLMNYDESKVTTDISQGWQWHDGWDGTTGFNTLETRRGYNISFEMDTTIFFNGLTSLTTTMGQINLPFSGSGGDTSLYGYYLVGNSLSCGINWDLVTRSNTTHVRNAIYITKDDYVASYVNGVGTNGGSAHIPPLQSFIVKTRATGTYITIPDNAREHNSTVRYKSAGNIPLIRLELSSEEGRDETVVRLDSHASAGFDNELDAGKMFGPLGRNPEIFSVMKGENYSINSIPWPGSLTTIPLSMKIPAEGSYTIKRSQLQGLGSSRVTMTDKLSGKTVDLLTVSEYSFAASAGTVTDRFFLNIYAAAPVPEKADIVTSSLKIFASGNKVCILPSGSEWDNIPGKVRIFDITGSMLMAGNNEFFNAGEIKEYYPGEFTGLVIVEVNAGNKRYFEKLVIAR